MAILYSLFTWWRYRKSPQEDHSLAHQTEPLNDDLFYLARCDALAERTGVDLTDEEACDALSIEMYHGTRFDRSMRLYQRLRRRYRAGGMHQ